MSDEITEFKQRLAEAIAWCLPHASLSDPEHSLRTPALRPAGFGEEVAWLADPLERVQQAREKSKAIHSQVRALAVARAELLRSEGECPVALARDLLGGRLLLYYPDETVSDGFSGECSLGFFDREDAPPWDTWLCYVGDRARSQGTTAYVISWVPAGLIELAERGIGVNPMDCIGWADHADEPFTDQLRSEGLLGS